MPKKPVALPLTQNAPASSILHNPPLTGGKTIDSFFIRTKSIAPNEIKESGSFKCNYCTAFKTSQQAALVKHEKCHKTRGDNSVASNNLPSQYDESASDDDEQKEDSDVEDDDPEESDKTLGYERFLLHTWSADKDAPARINRDLVQKDILYAIEHADAS